jgi:hypothetical protein
MRKGNCCSRIKYQEFPSSKGLNAILAVRAQNRKKGSPIVKKTTACRNNCNKNPLLSSSKSKRQIRKAKGSAKSKANFCIDLFVPEEARWRICHSSQDRISQLQMKLIYYTLNSNFKGKMDVISNFLSKARVGRDPPIPEWSWETQTKWKGQCRSDLMQSPVNILKSSIKKPSGDFNISYSFLPVLTMIKRNEKEIIATFMNFGGVVQVSIGGVYSLFTPTFISFRFPGEHVFEGRRYMGEMIVHLKELSSQRVKIQFN